MRLYIDTDTNQFVVNPLQRAPIDSVSFKRGDAAKVLLQFCNSVSVLSATAGKDINFGIKASGNYDGDYLVFTDSYTTDGNDYILTPSFNTVGLNTSLGSDGLTGNDIASVNTMLEITWSEDGTSWASSNIITAVINNDVNKGGEGTPVELPDALDWLEDNGLVYNTAVTVLTGGLSNSLDSLATTGIPVGSLYVIKSSAGQVYTYRLADSTSTTSVPNRVRPLDYNNPSNKRVWFLTSPYVSSLRSVGSVLAGSLAIENSSGSSGSIQGADLSAEREFQLPDSDGVIPSVPAYSDITAANAALDSGDFFWDSTLKKLRVATA